MGTGRESRRQEEGRKGRNGQDVPNRSGQGRYDEEENAQGWWDKKTERPRTGAQTLDRHRGTNQKRRGKKRDEKRRHET